MTDKKKKSDYKKIMKTLSKNYWIISTIVLAVILVVILAMGGIGGNGIGNDAAGAAVAGWAGEQVENVEVVAVEEEGGLYAVTFSYTNPETSATDEATIQITKDGSNIVLQAIPLKPQTTQTQPQQQETVDVPKSDVPEVELYVWSYCPYGVQAQGPLAEVASLLGDSITTKTYMYYDGHGAYETQQNKIQACIQQEAPEKYWDYATGFVADIYSTCGATKDVDCDLTASTTLLNSLGINSAAVLSCVESDGAALIAADSASAQSNGVTGSPTIFINGVKVQVSRTAEAIKTAVCSAYNEAPAECGEQLEAAAATPAPAAGSC